MRHRALATFTTLVFALGCSAGADPDGAGAGGSAGTAFGPGASGTSTFNTETNGAGGGGNGDPKTCAEAEMYQTYIGCDFYPTITANVVWSIFDYAVVVANAGDQDAVVEIDRGGVLMAGTAIPPNGLQTFHLPWVEELKGPSVNTCGYIDNPAKPAMVPDGAYHLKSSSPVTVYQFNPLQYAPQGGPPGKDWSQCPGNACMPFPTSCYSYSNDASLVLPSTALTNNYRVTGWPGWGFPANVGGHITVTAVQDGTTVTVTPSPTASIIGAPGIPAATPGQTSVFTLNQGDVAELFAPWDQDLTGSLVQSDKPVGVVFGVPCINIPAEYGTCDHIEETVLPAETWGTHYVVARPTGAMGSPVQFVVRLVGNVDGTQLTYVGAPPPNAPSTLNAGQFVDLGVIDMDFEVQGNHEFAVSMFQVGATLLDPNGMTLEQKGDPSQSVAIAVEQFRKKYVFLAPTDYDVSYVDVLMPMDAEVKLDGVQVGTAPDHISSTYGVLRLGLPDTNGGAHVLEASAPVGIQVLGYGSYTSYQYPGGLDLRRIAPPPPPPS